MAAFQSLGKHPDSNEILIIFVITGSIVSKHSSKRTVGMGSRQQDFFVEFIISFRTSSSDKSSKTSKNVRYQVSQYHDQLW